MKRKNTEDGFEVVLPLGSRGSTSKRARTNEIATFDASESEHSPSAVEEENNTTPSKRRGLGRPPKHNTANVVQTPTKNRKGNIHVNFATPTKEDGPDDAIEQTPLERNGDRSARRKSARRLIERSVGGDASDDDEMGQEDSLARRIWDEDQVDGSEDEENSTGEQEADIRAEPETPSKRGRGRPKARRKQRTPSPPRDLPPYEHYFFQNRPGGAKTSNNTLSSFSLLSHEDYFDKISAYKDPHEAEVSFLQNLHARSFDKWIFELEQGFNLCLYGWGSKRILLEAFASHSHGLQTLSKIVVVNGYNSSITVRDILTALANSFPSLGLSGQKLGSQPIDMLNTLSAALSAKPPSTTITLLINSLDSPSLRRPATQSILASLASSPHIRLVSTADTPNFPLLWDATLCAQFKWLYHDVTTFRPFDIELASRGGGGGVVDEVNALLGRSGRKMQGREGVMYVLRSLTENARNLFSLLLAELLSMDEEDLNANGGDSHDEDDEPEEEEEEDFALATPRKHKSKRSGPAMGKAGIDFRTLYQKAASQFIATNETTFRGLLREFFDHEMVVSRKDGMGGEAFGVPFRKEEMEGILEELAMEGEG